MPDSSSRESALWRAFALAAAVIVLVLAGTGTAHAAVLFGDQSVESTADSNPAGSAEAFSVLSQTTGTAESISVYLDASNQAGAVTVGLYATDSRDRPGVLLGSGEVADAQAGTWNTVPIAAVSVTAGETYWLAILGTGGTTYFRDRDPGTCTSFTLSQSDLTSLPPAWVNGPAGNACPISGYVNGTPASSYAFDDEFNGTSVDTNLWSVMDQHGDESNNELECYQPANTTEGSGVLTETALAQTVSCPDGSGTVNYTSGAVQMRSFNFEYGTVEARIQFAGGAGTWPAFWMLGAQCQEPTWLTNNCGWPYPGSSEIDIAEVMNDGGPASTVYENLITEAQGTDTCQPDVSGIATGYHVYTLVWTPSSLTFEIDGITTCTMGSGIPDEPMFVILNTALGGSGRTNISGLPQSTNVDWVHVTTDSPVNTAVPAISGSLTANSTLTATNGSWSTSPISPSYQWQRCTSAYNCENISDATDPTYQLGSGDVGNTVQVVVTAQSATGASAATSAATATVELRRSLAKRQLHHRRRQTHLAHRHHRAVLRLAAHERDRDRPEARRERHAPQAPHRALAEHELVAGPRGR